MAVSLQISVADEPVLILWEEPLSRIPTLALLFSIVFTTDTVPLKLYKTNWLWADAHTATVGKRIRKSNFSSFKV